MDRPKARDLLIIDADSHFHEPADWLATVDKQLAEQLPPLTPAEQFLDVVVGDLFASIPPALRPDPLALVPQPIRDGYDAHLKGLGEPTPQAIAAGATSEAAYLPEPRLKWMDERGIDVQLLLPSRGYHPYRLAARSGDVPLTLKALGAYNEWATRQVHGFTDRLIPVTVLDLVDLDWAIAEMTRRRAQGGVVAWVKPEPIGSKALSHPDFDRFWAAACGLGVTIMFHVGGARAPMNPGWADNGGNLPAFYRLAGIARQAVPQMALADMIFGGVLERFPKLGIIVSELGIDWLPHFLETIDLEADNDHPRLLNIGRYTLPLKPSEYVQRQIRVSVVRQQDVLRPTIERIPEGIVVFSSDFPHLEGDQEAVAIYDQQLGACSAAARAKFFGEAVQDVLRI